MLSPGTFYQFVKKDIRQNVRQRRNAIRDCLKDKKAQRAMIEACRQDLLLWVNLFVWQVDPKQKGERGKPGPFITYPFQDEALLKMLSWVERGRDGLLEKSRQMGASWMMLMLFTWLWLFHSWQTFLFISRNEAAVESQDPNSLFWKIDFILKALPDWMKPKDLRRRKRFFGNDDLSSSIFGEASTGKANVGGNTTAMGIDEFSQIDDDYEVLHRTSDSTQCRIFNGTHLGLDTAFYELTRRVDLEKLVLHWTMHPAYRQGLYHAVHGKFVSLDPTYHYADNFRPVLDGSPIGGPFPGLRSPWYDEQCVRKGNPRAVAMDLDINPEGSVTQFFDAMVIRGLQEMYCRPAFFEGDLEIDEDLARPRRLVERKGGPLRLWIHLSRDGLPPLGMYVIGGDLSNGHGRTPSVLSIVEVATGYKVGEYVTNSIEPTPLAAIAVALCWAFKDHAGNGAKLGWEVPGPGLTFGKRVVGLGYRNIYYRESLELLTPIPTDTPGWVSTTKTKPHLLEVYKHALQTREFHNPSWEALQECLSFRYTAQGAVEHSGEAAKNSPADAGVNHGDRVIADAIAHMMRKGRATPEKEVLKEKHHPGTLEGRRALYEAERRAEEWA